MKKRRRITLDQSLCVFCNNRNVNFLEESNKFFTSTECGHQVCQVCIETEEVIVGETKCPVKHCNKMWRKTRLSRKSKEALEYEKLKKIRSTIKREFNLRLQDFDSSPDYREYQELTENLIWKLSQGKDLDWIESERAKNREEHRDVIAKNTTRLAEKERKFQEEISKQEENELKLNQEIEMKEVELKRRKLLEEQELNLLNLGEITETTMTKEKRASLTERRKEQMKAYQGVMKLDKQQPSISKFWVHARLLQPKRKVVVESKMSEEFTLEQVARAGGYDTSYVSLKRNALLEPLR